MQDALVKMMKTVVVARVESGGWLEHRGQIRILVGERKVDGR